MDALCEDAVAEILARLDAVSVLRCRAVCKSRRRIATGSSFLAAHAARSPREMLVTTQSHTVSAIPLPVDPADDGATHFSLDPADGGTGRRRILCDPTQVSTTGTVTSCVLLFSLHGLLVFQERPGLYIICNPVTRQWTNLPPLGPEPCFSAFPCGFYFHSSSGEYRLLCHADEARWGDAAPWSCKDKDYYYVLAAGGTQPRRLPRGPANGPGRLGHDCPVAHGEIIYWASLHPEATRAGKILAFNTASETFRLMSRPSSVTRAALLELDGFLCAVTMPCATRLDIWALQDHEAERWTLRLRMEVPPPRCIASGTFSVTTAISAGDGSILIGNPYYPLVLLCDIKGKRVLKEMRSSAGCSSKGASTAGAT